jgi:hypothetical protein
MIDLIKCSRLCILFLGHYSKYWSVAVIWIQISEMSIRLAKIRPLYYSYPATRPKKWINRPEGFVTRLVKTKFFLNYDT